MIFVKGPKWLGLVKGNKNYQFFKNLCKQLKTAEDVIYAEDSLDIPGLSFGVVLAKIDEREHCFTCTMFNGEFDSDRIVAYSPKRFTNSIEFVKFDENCVALQELIEETFSDIRYKNSTILK